MSKISVVIPSSGDRNYVESLLQSMVQNLSTYSLEIIVVCNPVRTELDQLLQIYPSINLIILQTDIRGVNHARQLGLQRTTNNLVLFLDDDCRFTSPLQINTLYNEIQNHPQLFAVGGFYSQEQRPLNPIANAYSNNQMNWLRLGLVDNAHQLSAYLIGGFFIMNKSMASHAYLEFDTKMIFGGTEKDFFLRAHLQGLKMRLLDVSIQHDYPNVYWPYMIKVYKQGRGLRYINDKGLTFEPKYLDFSKKNIWLVFFDVIFWAGYYLSKNEYIKYFKYLYKITSDYTNEKKLIILNKLKKHL
jgi:glycosyltransferase involved in cell wall biosynthesis